MVPVLACVSSALLGATVSDRVGVVGSVDAGDAGDADGDTDGDADAAWGIGWKNDRPSQPKGVVVMLAGDKLPCATPDECKWCTACSS